MNKTLIIWGAGGHGKVVLDAARSMGRFDRFIFVDDGEDRAGSTFCNCPVVSGPHECSPLSGSGFVIAIGDNRCRARRFNEAVSGGFVPMTLIHPSATLAPSARIGAGTVVLAGVIVNVDAVVGENCIINSGAVVEHDVRIEDHVHLSPRTVLGGQAMVGSYAHVGIGAVIMPGASVGHSAIVGAGALVVKEAPAHRTVLGVPARIHTPKVLVRS